MSHIVPQSLFGRAVLVLVLGLGLSHGLSMAIHYGDRSHRLSLFGGQTIAAQIIAAREALMAVPAPARDQIMARLSGPGFLVGADPAIGHAGANDWRARLIGDQVDAVVAGPTDVTVVAQSLCVLHSDRPSRTSPPCENDSDTVRAAVTLSDGQQIVMLASLGGADRSMVVRMVLEMAVMVAGIAVLAVWAGRWLTRPLTTLAEAAQRLGRDLHAPEVDRTGPAEIRSVAGAFNDMQARLRRFIDDRTQMLGAISHDLRTPITRLRLRAEFVDDAVQQNKMLADLDDMERMIDGALAFVRDEASTERPQPVDLTALVESVCNDAADAGGHVVCRGGVSKPVRARPLALKRGISNLVANAVKYGVEAKVSLFEVDGHAVITVDDAGPGIAAAELDRVFEPFYRLNTAGTADHAGAGLGLAVARSVFRGHGGDVCLQNHADGGLRATATLPL